MREERRSEGGVADAASCCHALCCPVLSKNSDTDMYMYTNIYFYI